MLALAVAVHVLAAVVWVGGMFFAHMALRPSVAPMTPADRLALWGRVFPRFFAWVWAAVIALQVTGNAAAILLYGRFHAAPPHIDLMAGIGTLMTVLFVYLYFVPYRRFRAALAQGELPTAAGHQARIRQIVATNLALGLLTTVVAAAGRYW